MYRIAIWDKGMQLYLMDWIVCIGMDHPQFTARWDGAMIFGRFDAALKYHRQLKAMGYDPHIV